MAGSDTNLESLTADLTEQVEDLVYIHDHPTRIIANLDVPTDAFSDYDDPNRATFPLDGVIRTFLYQHVYDISQAELARRLRGTAYLFIRFDLGDPMRQQTISHNWRRRLTRTERHTIKEMADHIHDLCVAHGVMQDDAPALDPDDLNADIEEEQIMRAVRNATELGFKEFTADRADNAKYPLEAYTERYGYLTMTNAGATTARRRFNRLSPRDETPHGSSHVRTMKKIADPDP
jgi:hypothetical protein